MSSCLIVADNPVLVGLNLETKATFASIRNPTFHLTYHSDTTGQIQHHRTASSLYFGPIRRHQTTPTVCSHLIIPRSWVRSPPALAFGPRSRSHSPAGSSLRRITWSVDWSAAVFLTRRSEVAQQFRLHRTAAPRSIRVLFDAVVKDARSHRRRTSRSAPN